jgi:carbamoyl-phosphate synthase large subunit
MERAVDLSTGHPVLIDKYILGKEVEVDGICGRLGGPDPRVMEHFERGASTQATASRSTRPERSRARRSIRSWRTRRSSPWR